ncbi:NitT/TauT family transport system ATP-binding protein [Thermanaeromonas toyohensis ToBE]|uniref:NitT/TauT family transport system ATP-binding protein n=1 Tax=Thermanaeromonas toyohensis ToBE TaxID=698762 RepID=A0A1W1VKP0_9FIRM|nr:ABC transporter ATP-binding protein [Thermanaeromonas toyohensis]SMB93853.1 NitT/TauT family transport system ATP-binding protein [Thermanaeromonas toyohensis ToBE]
MIVVQGVSKVYNSGRAEKITALRDISLNIGSGEFACILGPSGCGKSTLLNILAGFERPSSGEVLINGRPVTGSDPRNIAIFQSYGLFPWRTVLGNVGFGLEVKGVPRPEREKRAREMVRLVGLEGFEHHYPHELSGGMQQRVALARALAVEPEILFLDEPFGALDTFTRFRLQEELIRLWLKRRPTIVFVTHDLEEAVYLAERIIIMSPHPGRIKTILPVPLGYPRDRTAYDFIKVREQVYTELKLKPTEEVEYYI